MDQNQQAWENLYNDSYHRPRYPASDLVQFTFKHFKRNGKILELACGCGRHVKFLAENGFEAYGCDYSENGIAHSKKLIEENNLKADLKVANMSNIPYKNDFFDGVISYGAMFYGTKEEIEKCAKEIYRVLKKDGKAYLKLRSTDDYRHGGGCNNEVIINVKDPKKPGFNENGMRVYHFDKKEIKRIYSKFSNIEINHIRHSFDNDSYADDNFIVILTK